MDTLFTMGYEKRTLDEFLSLLQRAKIDVVVDVRETPWSHKPGFSKRSLQAALLTVGIQYEHAVFAGNPKRIRARATSATECLSAYKDYLTQEHAVLDSFENLIGQHIAIGKRVCIICFERHPMECHRSVLADTWKGRKRRRIHHLAIDELQSPLFPKEMLSVSE